MDAVLLGALAGVLFGAFTVAIRWGLSRGVPVELGASVSASVAFAVVTAVALVTGAFADHIDARDVLVFAAIGAAVPGFSQIIFVQAVRLAGAALIVAAGASLSFERVRPEGFRALGALLAIACAALFAVRDTLVRWGSEDATLGPLLRTVVSLGAAALVVVAWSYLTRRSRPPAHVRGAIRPFLPAGICLGAAYLCLIVALDRGRVTIVAPLNATQSLWGVIFAAAFLGRREAIGPRLLVAAVLVVAGGVLIGVSR